MIAALCHQPFYRLMLQLCICLAMKRIFDIKVLWLTAKKVLLRNGISAEDEATMPRFTGAPNP
jgi:hypothetical protein